VLVLRFDGGNFKTARLQKEEKVPLVRVKDNVINILIINKFIKIKLFHPIKICFSFILNKTKINLITYLYSSIY